MDYSRRDLSVLLPALLAANTAAAEDKNMPAKVFSYEDMPVKKNGPNESRAVFADHLHTGFPVAVHMTSLAPGQMPHPPHKHPNEEVICLRSGQLDANFGGKITHVTAGSIIYMASNEEHSWKNNGSEPAEYFVIELGDKKA